MKWIDEAVELHAKIVYTLAFLGYASFLVVILVYVGHYFISNVRILLSLSFFVGFVTIFYLLEKKRSLKRVREIGRDDAFDEVPKSLGWFMTGITGLIQSILVFLVLMLSTLIDLRLVAPIWGLVIYGTLIGCGGAGSLCLWGKITSDIHKPVIGWITLFLIVIYPAITAFFAHFIDVLF